MPILLFILDMEKEQEDNISHCEGRGPLRMEPCTSHLFTYIMQIYKGKSKTNLEEKIILNTARYSSFRKGQAHD